MLALTVSWKITVSWLTTPNSERRDPSGMSLRSRPSIVIRPPVGSMNLGKQVHQGALPGPGRSHQRHDLTGSGLEVDPAQHRTLGLVLEVHVVEPDRLARRQNGLLAGLAPGLGLRIQHLEEPLGRGDRQLHLGGKLGQRLHRRHEAHGHRDEGDEHRRRQCARPENHVGADPDQDERDHRGQGLGDGARGLAERVGPHHTARVAPRALAESRPLVLFRPEGLHEPDSAHGLLGHRHELAALLKCLSVAALQSSEDRAEPHRDQGSGDQRHQRELPRHEEQEDHVGHGRHCLPQHVRERERDDRAGFAGVVQDASDQLPDLHLAEEGQGQVLQVPVHVVPDVSLDVLLHVHGEQAGTVQREVLDAQRPEHQQAHVAQRVQRIAGTDPGPEPAIEESLEAAHVGAAQDLHPEQRLQERDQEHQA